MKTNIPERLTALRNAMKQQQIDAYIIPSSDPHLSEYPADCWKAREWMSGFTGSAGTLVVTADKAGLWTDSRYFLQAGQQLEGTGIDLYKMGLPDTATIPEFLLHELQAGANAALNGQTYSAADAIRLESELKKKAITLSSDADLIEPIWQERPAIPDAPLFEMPEALSGQSTEEKLSALHAKLREAGADSLILASLDEVAWTFNIRGTDVAYNPVAISYAFISENENILFIHPKKLNPETAGRLKAQGVKLADYSMIYTYLSRLPENARVFVDMQKTNVALYRSLPAGCTIIEGISPASHLKSIKNETEINGFRSAVVKDGVALVRFYNWLENQMAASEKVTEISLSEKLTAFRAEQPQYIMDSFETIAGYAAHGAIVHYSATPETDATLLAEGLLLIDSGAQYLDGTTDITRTTALGEPTEQMKKDFTRVLKGTISLAKSKFPAGTRGSQIDLLARKALWDAGINYLHGTGHGIGHCLNVHEGPQSIRMEENPVVLKPGMVISDEPAMYRTGEYGIRTENMILCRTDSETEFGQFLGFETLTLCPIDTRLIIPTMLSARERAWLNKYHQMVYDKLSPYLDEAEKTWLKNKTAEI